MRSGVRLRLGKFIRPQRSVQRFANSIRMALTSRDSVVRYFDEIAGLLSEYEERRIDADRLVLTVKNVTLGVQVGAKHEPDGFAPYLATSDTQEISETGAGLSVTPSFAAQPSDDASRVAANIREILGEPDMDGPRRSS
jgi:hypothetical protein